MITENLKQHREEQWTEQYYKESKETIANKDILPIVVPSYRRGYAASTLQALKDFPELKVVVFIYEEEFDLYRHLFETYPHIQYQLCSGFRGIAPKRKYITERMVQLGMPEFFEIDDDATAFFYTKHGSMKKDPTKYKAEKTQIDIQDFFRMFQYIIKYKALEKIDLCGIIFDNGAWAQDLRTLPDIIYIGGQAFCFYLDAKACLDKGLNYYVEDKIWEDFDFSMQVINAGLNSCQIRYLTASTPTMTPGDSVATAAGSPWAQKSVNLYKRWGDLIRFKPMKGELNAKIRWTTIRNQLKKDGHLTITYNPIYMEFINKNDYDGLTHYIEQEKNKNEEV